MMHPQAPLWTQLRVQKWITEIERVRAHSLAYNISKVEGHAGASGWD